MDPTLIPVLIYSAIAVMIFLMGSVTVIRQGHVGVAVMFGKYRRILPPGISFLVPFAERVFTKLSLQNRASELEFQAITGDQANVNFKALIIYSVQNDREETVLKAAFKFIDEKSFMQALIRSIEGSIRALVALKKQNEILGLRQEIVHAVNGHLEGELNDWGFHLINLQINDISFDEAIMRSMAQVVASNNMMLAAKNEAQAQYITKTRVAEAEAQAKRVVASAARDADEMRGEGNSLLRQKMAQGLADAGKIMGENAVDPAFMLYTMWLDTMKNVAEHSHGNILSFDGSMDGFQKTMRQMTKLRGPETGVSNGGH